MPTPLLAPDAPMSGEIKNDPQAVVNLAQDIGLRRNFIGISS